MSPNLFDKQKLACSSKIDLSRKGSIDEPILNLILTINSHSDYFSLSSCSGRIVVFAETESETGGRKKAGQARQLETNLVQDEKDEQVKVNCDWIHVSHERLDAQLVLDKLQQRGEKPGCIVMKFEPFVLHAQCRDLNAAKLMHTAAIEAGFRNSGITLGKAGKIVSAVRSTHGLEAPLSDESGTLLVTPDYIKFVVDKCNQKLDQNLVRIRRFQIKLSEIWTKAKIAASLSASSTSTVKRRHPSDRGQSAASNPNDEGGRLVADLTESEIEDSCDIFDDLSLFVE